MQSISSGILSARMSKDRSDHLLQFRHDAPLEAATKSSILTSHTRTLIPKVNNRQNKSIQTPVHMLQSQRYMYEHAVSLTARGERYVEILLPPQSQMYTDAGPANSSFSADASATLSSSSEDQPASYLDQPRAESSNNVVEKANPIELPKARTMRSDNAAMRNKSTFLTDVDTEIWKTKPIVSPPIAVYKCSVSTAFRPDAWERVQSIQPPLEQTNRSNLDGPPNRARASNTSRTNPKTHQSDSYEADPAVASHTQRQKCNKVALAIDIKIREILPPLEQLLRGSPAFEHTNIACNLIEQLIVFGLSEPSVRNVFSNLWPIVRHALYSSIPSHQRSVAELLSASLFSSHTVDAQLELANHLAHATPAVQGFTEPAIATSALAATFHTVNGWRERMTMSTHLPYYSVAADMHGMLGTAISRQKSVQGELVIAADLNRRYEQRLQSIQEMLDRKTTRCDLLERSESVWHRKIVETQEQLMYSKEEIERLIDENAELKQMTIRIRQGRFSTVTDPNPQILERMHSLEKELADNRFSESVAKSKIDNQASELRDAMKERDAQRTKIEILEQAVEILSKKQDESQGKGGSMMDNAAFEIERKQRQENDAKDAIDIEKSTPLSMMSEEDIELIVSDSRIRTVAMVGGGIIVGRGLSDQIPIFLRFEGTLRQFSLSKGEVEMLVKKVWALKLRSDKYCQEHSIPTKTLDEFFHEFICRRFKEIVSIMEFSYNFVTALRIYKFDADCELFYVILFRELSEATYYDQMLMLSSFKAALERWMLFDARGRRTNNVLDKDIFFSGLRAFFPVKNEKSMQDLRTVAYTSLIDKIHGHVDVKKLLDESDDGNQSEFMEMLRDQYLSEIQGFCKAIWNKLQAADFSKSSVIPCGQIEAILKDIDPNKHLDDVRLMMQRGLGSATYGSDQIVHIPTFFKALKMSGLVNRTGHYVASAQPSATTTFAIST